MDVVGHQAVAPHSHRRLAHLFGQDVTVDVLVPVLEENRLAPVSSRRHVARTSRGDKTGSFAGAFVLAGAMSIIGVASWLFVVPDIRQVNWAPHPQAKA